MNYLFVIERFYPFCDASAKILKNLLSSSMFANHELHVLAAGDSTMTFNNISFHNISYKENFCHKAKKKIFMYKFIKDKKFINLFKHEIEKICKNHHIDHIIYVVGNMNFLLLATHINKDYSLIFYDTFIENFFYKKETIKHIVNIQNCAFQKAKKIFLLNEYFDLYLKHHSNFKFKFVPFYITAFYDGVDKKGHDGILLLHTGAFFSKLREPTAFFNFLDVSSRFDSNIKAISLGILPKKFKNIRQPNNLTVLQRVFGDDYGMLISKSDCLVLVDNFNSYQIPSKAVEYIGYNKKILFFTSGKTKTGELLSRSRNVFIVNGQIDTKTVESFEKFLQTKTFNDRALFSEYENDYVANILLENLK